MSSAPVSTSMTLRDLLINNDLTFHPTHSSVPDKCEGQERPETQTYQVRQLLTFILKVPNMTKISMHRLYLALMSFLKAQNI